MDKLIHLSAYKKLKTKFLISESKRKVDYSAPTVCEICGKHVSRKGRTKHMNIHTRRRTYPCTICGKIFLEAAHRKTHQKTHSGDKSYACLICSKAFVQKGNLGAHEKTHRPFSHLIKENKIKNTKNKKTSKKSEKKEPASQVFVELERVELNIPSEVPPTNILSLDPTGSQTIQQFMDLATDWMENNIETTVKDTLSNQQKPHIPTLPSFESSSKTVSLEKNASFVDQRDEPCTNATTETQEKPINDWTKSGKKEIWEKLMEDIGNFADVKNVLEELGDTSDDIMTKLIHRLKIIPTNNVLTRNSSGSIEWHCWNCSANFSRRHLLIRHRLTHTPFYLHPHRCHLCSRTFTQAGNLTHHLLVHQKEYRFTCERCGKQFRHKSHMKKHCKDRKARYECYHCGKGMNTKFHLEEHLRSHLNDRPFQCSTCKKDFTALSTYKRHLQVHLPQVLERCYICGKTFKNHNSLVLHEASHFEEKRRHVCECGRSFSYAHSLRRHEPVCPQAAVPPSRSFQCPTCPKAFQNAAGLKRHSATHDTTKSFTCRICGLSLKTTETHMRHMRRRHSDLVHTSLNPTGEPQKHNIRLENHIDLDPT